MANYLTIRADFPPATDCTYAGDGCWWHILYGTEAHDVTVPCAGWTLPTYWTDRALAMSVRRPCEEVGYATQASEWLVIPLPEPSGLLWAGLVGLALMGRRRWNK